MSKKNKIDVVLIDDEANALMGLETIINEYCDQLNVVGKAESAFHALKILKESKPDLIFLDVEMPGATGFDMLVELPEPKPLVIFTTAYEKHAIKAIKSNAVDYLLKPIDVDELTAAVKKAEAIINRTSALPKNKAPDKKIKLSSQDEIIFALPSDIVHIEGDGRYATVYLRSKRKLVLVKNLGEFEEELAPYGFFRVHKSHLVNCEHIRKVANIDGGFIEMSNGKSIEISRRKRAEFLQFLKK